MNEDQFIETFKEEALELLGNLEAALLDLEESPQDKELLSAVFRVMHTIKGSAAMFGLEKISGFAHEVESILSALRDGKITVSKELIGHTLLARDHILGMLEDLSGAADPVPDSLLQFLEEFKLAVGFGADSPKQVVKEGSAADIESERDEAPAHTREARKNSVQHSEKSETWQIVFKPGPEMFRRGGNPLGLIQELRSFGELVVIPVFSDIPPLTEFEPEECRTSWFLYLTTSVSENEIRDVFIFVEDYSSIKIVCLENLIDENTPVHKKLGEILVDSGKLERSTLEKYLGSQRKIGEILVEEKLVSHTDLKVALEEQKQLQKVQKAKVAATDMSTIRVKSEKLDLLMGLVGELVTVHARILETSKNTHNEELISVVEQFGRLTDDLRSNTMSIRMVPIGTTFSSFKRLVRDLSVELGKKVELETDGGETELDKTVIEKLNDPLIHIIRNSLDHGIEVPVIRKERNKPECGIIRLSALQTGASVYITIEDDGNGLDKDAIFRKAVRNGLIQSDDVLTDEEIYRLIFAAGFSTKETVSSVSGRGVGMDVVNRQMEMINGTVSIESRPLKGSTITLKIPLTLAIIDGLLVRIQGSYFVVPLSVVVGCMEFAQSKQVNDHNIVIFHDKQLPFVNMREFFDLPGERQAIEQIVIVNIKDQHVGILVDQVIGGNQTVIKPLGKLFKQAEGVSSGTILGDGSVALILDVEQIVDFAEKDEA